ncbi:cytochrome P450 [Serendipita vermifera]|nr:cytochrome P450 [Serendipita vermifera]
MGRRSNIYSGRPYTTMGNKLMYFHWTPILVQPGLNHTEQRKPLRKAIGPQSVHEYDRIIQNGASNIIKALLTSDGDPFLPISREVGAVVISCAFGEKVQREHGGDLIETNRQRAKLNAMVMSRFWIVNIFPFVQYIPAWLPGVTFRRIAIEGARLGKKVRFNVFNFVEKDLTNGIVDESIVTKHINDPGMSKDHLRDVGGSMYLAGFETTSISISNFIYAVMLHPEVQKKLHDELDEQIGHGRFPSMAEIEHLQYFHAAWSESMRWNVTTPLGVPHVNTEDDVWNGYYIPKGSIIQCNIGCVLRDPQIFGEDADAYNPNCFLPEFNPRAADLPDMSSVPFGFGKRICPGRHLVSSNEQANPLGLEFEDSILRRPINLRCKFIPRRLEC